MLQRYILQNRSFTALFLSLYIASTKSAEASLEVQTRLALKNCLGLSVQVGELFLKSVSLLSMSSGKKKDTLGCTMEVRATKGL